MLMNGKSCFFPILKYNYSPTLKKWGLYWICLVLPSFCGCHSLIQSSVTFQMKIFVTLFSGTVRPRRLNFEHVDSGQMYRVYRNRTAAAYSSLYSFFFLSNFQTLKFFVTLFSGTVRPRRLKPYTRRQWADVLCIPESGCCCLFYSSLYFSFFFLCNFQTLKCFVTLFSATVRPRRLKLLTHMDNGWMYSIYQCNSLSCPFRYLVPVDTLPQGSVPPWFILSLGTLYPGVKCPPLKFFNYLFFLINFFNTTYFIALKSFLFL